MDKIKKAKIDQQKIEKEFIENFKFSSDFSDFTKFEDAVGFSVTQKLFKESDDVSVLEVFIKIENKELASGKIAIRMKAYSMNEETKYLKLDLNLDEPLFIESNDDYFYDYNKKEFYSKNKKIISEKIISDFYKLHIKTTKKFSGFCLRLKLRFIKIFMPFLMKIFSKACLFLLFFISGNKYYYNVFGEIEKINDKDIRDVKLIEEERKKIQKKLEEEIKNEKKKNGIKFFGYKVSNWTMVFYSIFHLFVYLLFFVIFESELDWLVGVFKNSFLVVNYAIFSLWVIDFLLPELFKHLIVISIKSILKYRFKQIKI